MSHTHPAPTTFDNPVLDIGGDVGALLIHTPPEFDDAEIDISPAAAPADRTHNQVHPRRTPSGTVHSALFPALPAGDYTIWRDADTPHGHVTIDGGRITEYRWS